MIKIGGRYGGFRTVSSRSCSGITAELIETDAEGVQTVLTRYEINGIAEACEVC